MKISLLNAISEKLISAYEICCEMSIEEIDR